MDYLEHSALDHGLAALSSGDLDRAIPLLASAAEDGSGFTLLAYGTALLRRRRYQASIEPLERAVALLPDQGLPLAYLGMARLHALDPVGAREAVERALAIAPESFVVHLKHAEFLFRLGYYREALAAAERALDLTAPDAESLAFADRLATLARAKAPQAYTRQPGRLPRLTLPSWMRWSRRPAVAATSATAVTPGM
jgi:tetratricopeptide (TPR) repeat protein